MELDQKGDVDGEFDNPISLSTSWYNFGLAEKDKPISREISWEFNHIYLTRSKK